VVFLNLFDALGVTTMVECIMTRTPLLINRVGAVAEYLGDGYPLYYATLDEAAEKLQDTDLLLAARDYLACLPWRDELRLDSFAARLQNTAVYRGLPDPSPPPHFRPRQLTVFLCSYNRVETLSAVLDGFARQDFPGSFELVLWNNNVREWPTVEAVAARFRDRLDLKLIQSTENYYCVGRLAMPALMQLVDDYWLSFVLSHHLNVPLRKIRCGDAFRFTDSADDPTRAMHLNPAVREQRVNFYVSHMRQGWPAGRAVDPAAG